MMSVNAPKAGMYEVTRCVNECLAVLCITYLAVISSSFAPRVKICGDTRS